MDVSAFLRLLPMTDQDKHVSISSIDPDNPKLYWILRDADFKVWESANNSQVLLLFGGPPGCDMTGVSSLIAKQETSRRGGAVFHLSCSMEGLDAITTFTYSVLRHILNGSDARQTKSITETFLLTLLLKIIQRDRSRFKHPGFSAIALGEILRAEGGGHLEALTKASPKYGQSKRCRSSSTESTTSGQMVFSSLKCFARIRQQTRNRKC
jgi:hypothetical protein